MLRLGTGEEIAGADLARVVEGARQFRRVLDAFPTHYPRHILEQAAHRRGVRSRARPMPTCRAWPTRWPSGSIWSRVEYETRLAGPDHPGQGHPARPRAARGRRGAHARRRGAALGRGAQARAGRARALRDIYRDPSHLVRKDRDMLIHGPIDLLEAILDEGEKGLHAAALQGAGRDEPRPAVGNHARPGGAHAAAGARSTIWPRPTISSPS